MHIDFVPCKFLNLLVRFALNSICQLFDQQHGFIWEEQKMAVWAEQAAVPSQASARNKGEEHYFMEEEEVGKGA